MKALLIVLCLVCVPVPAPAGRRPNVVFILTDDQRWDALSCMGNEHLQTPHIDRLAEEGALRTEEWKYIRYPHGDGSPDKHLAELYNLKADPGERNNLIRAPRHAALVKTLSAELDRVIAEAHEGRPDTMPLDEGIKSELPDEKIR